MKKIFIWILSTTIIVALYMSQAFSSTLFFTTKDGRLFCEVDSFDGSYEECTLAETAGMKLEKAVFPSARLIDTPNEKICVEFSTQVDMSLCQEEIDLMKKYLTAKTPTTSSGITSNTGISLSGSTNSGTITTTWVIITGSTASGNIKTWSTSVKPIQQQVQMLVDNIWTSDDWSAFAWKLYSLCIPDYWSDECMVEVQNTVNIIKEIGVYTITGGILLVFYIFIFWLSMIGHVLGNPVPRKFIWIFVVILLFFPGAMIYYFLVKRPFTADHIASLPKEERSFF